MISPIPEIEVSSSVIASSTVMSSANGMDAASTVIGYSTQLTPAGNVTCEGHEIPAASVVAVTGSVASPLESSRVI